ncbi:MAG: hypothetical protein J1F01_09350 [Oscillospiraceae bacterium]|nr:hypothetical protein [Oscillospiraceae bacterium]
MKKKMISSLIIMLIFISLTPTVFSEKFTVLAEDTPTIGSLIEPKPTPTATVEPDIDTSFDFDSDSIKTIPNTNDTLYGPKVNIGGSSFNLFEFPIGASIKTPVADIKYNSDAKKYQVTIGFIDKTALNNDKKKNETYHEIKEFINFLGRKTTGQTWNKYQRLQKKLKSKNMKMGFSFDATPVGYLEFDSGGKFLEGSIAYILNLDANVKINPIAAVPVLYIKVGLEVDGTGKFGIKYITSNMDYQMFGLLDIDMSPYIGIGAGNSGLANAEGGFKGTLDTDLEITGKSFKDSFSAYLKGELYLKAQLLYFVNIDKRWPIPNQIELYPNFGNIELASIEYDDNKFEMIPRNYGAESSEFVANSFIELMSVDSIDINTFKTNVYPYSEPQLIELYDGRELMVWVDDDMSRSDENRTILMYSINTNGTWSEPTAVYDNGTADFTPKLVATDNGAALVWQKVNTVQNSGSSMLDIFCDVDLYYSELNGATWATPTKLTDNNSIYEYGHTIASNGYNVSVTWLENSENDYYSQTGTESIYAMRKDWYYGWENASLIASDLAKVTDIESGYIGYTHTVVYTVDLDGDINTPNDVELYEIFDENNIQTRITNDAICDSDIYFSDNAYYWVHGDILYERNFYSFEPIDININPGYLSNAKILTNGNNKMILWEQTDGFSSDLYAAYYDNYTWGAPIRLTEDNKKIRESNGYMNDDGSVRLVFGQAEIDENADDIYGRCNLMISSISDKADIEVTSADCSYIYYTPGEEATIWATVQNNSSSTINDFNVTVSSNESRIIQQNITIEIASGASATIEIPYTLPNDLSHKTYTVTVTTTDIAENDVSNNTISFEMGLADIVTAATINGNIVSVSLTNNGYINAENVVCNLTTADGTVIETKEIGRLAVDASQDLTFTVNDADAIIVSVTTDSEENLYANNNVSLSFNESMPTGIYIALGEYDVDNDNLIARATVVNNEDINRDISVIFATYTDGKLNKVIFAPINISSGNAQIIEQELAIDGSDTIKMFAWDSLNGMIPYGKAISMDIKYLE